MLAGARLPVRRDDSVANYLAGLGTTAAVNVTNSIVPGAVPLVGAASGGISSGEISGLAFSIAAPGSKPQALHTEYATGSANWVKPYGASTDIIFYMMRAG